MVPGPPCSPIAAGAVHKADAFPEVLPAPLKQQLLHLDMASIHGILRHSRDSVSRWPAASVRSESWRHMGSSWGHPHTSKGVRKKRSTGLGVHP